VYFFIAFHNAIFLLFNGFCPYCRQQRACINAAWAYQNTFTAKHAMRGLFNLFLIAPLNVQYNFAQTHWQVFAGCAGGGATAAGNAGKYIGVFFY
jgi:hypothetical protein